MSGLKTPALPLALATALAGLTLVEPARGNPRLTLALLGWAGILGLWSGTLAVGGRRDRSWHLDVVSKKQHWVQALAQTAVLLYWGAYWRPVYDFGVLILAQIVFAYAFDMLLGWSRRGAYTLGFGPVPVVLSINLFLWFRPDWFYLQFAMIALGFAAREWIRWNKDGRQTHIFNPSSLPLALFAAGLLVTGQSGLTLGSEIASTQFYPPGMYLVIFLVAIPGQILFGVTTMTMSAVLATYAFGLAYFWWTGIYFFYDSYVPIAVFLGMHLLFNDPSTSPRTGLGRVLYGVLYGAVVVVAYPLLGHAGLPTFYDKLLPVPLLNLSVRALDRLGRARLARRFQPAPLASVAVWAVAFVALAAAGGVGDEHPGQWVPFWQQACEAGRPYACPYLADRTLNLCNQGSGWACNEAGLLDIALAVSGEDLRRLDSSRAATPLRRGCGLGFEPACRNLEALGTGRVTFLRETPPIQDYPLLVRGSKGPVRERDPAALRARACGQGWTGACD